MKGIDGCMDGWTDDGTINMVSVAYHQIGSPETHNIHGWMN